ncbi:MAG: alpha/beta hydrolase [Geodermatophilaceae bacterium]
MAGVNQQPPIQIRGTTVLPSRRQPLTLQTADGLDLVAELALPQSRLPVGTMICVHPLPTEGGMMDSHLFRKAANRLPALADFAVLRFNTRGTKSEHGRSAGEFSHAIQERFDVAAAIEYAEFIELSQPWLVGWSFGTDLTLKYGCDPGICGAILISPPLRYATAGDLDVWAESGKPVVALVPEFDDYLRPAAARQRFSAIPQAEVVAVEGARHLFVGHTERVLDEIVARLNPAAYPLPDYYQPAQP